MRPAALARSRETDQGLSRRYDSFVRTTGSWREAMSATRMVEPRSCWRDWVRTYRGCERGGK